MRLMILILVRLRESQKVRKAATFVIARNYSNAKKYILILFYIASKKQKKRPDEENDIDNNVISSSTTASKASSTSAVATTFYLSGLILMIHNLRNLIIVKCFFS